MNDSKFNVAWREFAKDDAEITAPVRLRSAVMRAWDSAQHAEHDLVGARSTGWRRMSLVATLAAAAALTVVVGTSMRETDRRVGPPRTPADVPPLAAAAASSPMDGFRLIADPTFENESFEIVRLRLPRANLETIGVALIGPEITGLVDVDVVVGGDGLPRAIQRIRPVVGIQ